MPPMGPRGKGPAEKPKDIKKTFSRILKYIGKSKGLLFVVFISLVLSSWPEEASTASSRGRS